MEYTSGICLSASEPNAKPTVQHQFLCGSNNLAVHNHIEILGHNFPLSLSEKEKAPQKIHAIERILIPCPKAVKDSQA